MRHAWVFVLCLYGCTHAAAPDTPHYFSCIPEPANDPLPEHHHARIYPRIYHCVRLDPALIYGGPADRSFWGDRFTGRAPCPAMAG